MRYLLCMALLLAGTASVADMAENGHRARAAGIDVVTYHTTVKDVVVIVGALRQAMPWRGPATLPYRRCRE